MAAAEPTYFYELFDFINHASNMLAINKPISKININDIDEKVLKRNALVKTVRNHTYVFNVKQTLAYLSRHFIRNTDTFIEQPEGYYFVNPEIQKMWETNHKPKILKQRTEGEKIKDLDDLKKLLETKKLFLVTQRLPLKRATFGGTEPVKGTKDMGLYQCFMFYVEYVREDSRRFYFNLYYDLDLNKKVVKPADGRTNEEFYVDKEHLFETLFTETMNQYPDFPMARPESIFELDTKWINRKLKTGNFDKPSVKSLLLWRSGMKEALDREPGTNVLENVRSVLGTNVKDKDEDEADAEAITSGSTGRKIQRRHTKRHHTSHHLRKTRRHRKSNH